nr:hypothetical protein CFP56_30791 [Quercus suber]
MQHDHAEADDSSRIRGKELVQETDHYCRRLVAQMLARHSDEHYRPGLVVVLRHRQPRGLRLPFHAIEHVYQRW